MAIQLHNGATNDYARLLYLRESNSPELIAEKTGETLSTVLNWARSGSWDVMRRSLYGTKLSQLDRLYEVNEILLAQFKSSLTGDQATDYKPLHAMVKCSTMIRNLESRTGIGELIETGLSFVNFLHAEDPDSANEVGVWYDRFVQSYVKMVR